jgi:hypothetical protein
MTDARSNAGEWPARLLRRGSAPSALFFN